MINRIIRLFKSREAIKKKVEGAITEGTVSTENLWTKGFHKFRKDKIGIISFSVVFIYLLIACGVWAGVWGTEWDEISYDSLAPISVKHWCGTNLNGQDILERALYGTRVAFEIGFMVAILTTIIGAVLGGIAGYFHGTKIDQIIVWMYGTMESIPYVLFAAGIGFAMKDSPYGIYVAMVSVMWTPICGIIRGEFIKIKNLEYVESARAIGVSVRRIILKHMMPNTYHLLLINTTLIFVMAIKTEVILSFLGIGVKEGISWGLMFADAADEVQGGHFNVFITTSLFMFFLVLAFSVFADALQDALDPKKV